MEATDFEDFEECGDDESESEDEVTWGPPFDLDAAENWEEDVAFDGHNWVSRATGSEWKHERLWRSEDGEFFLEVWWGRNTLAEWCGVPTQQAVKWLFTQGETADARRFRALAGEDGEG